MLNHRRLSLSLATAFIITSFAVTAETNATKESQWPEEAPKELVACVSDFLDGSDFVHAMEVCKAWKQALDANLFLYVPSNGAEFLQFVSENSNERIRQVASRRPTEEFANLIYRHFGPEIAHAQSEDALLRLWSQACELINIALSLDNQLDRQPLINFTNAAFVRMRESLIASHDHFNFFALAVNEIKHHFEPSTHPTIPLNNWLLYCDLLQAAHSTGDTWAAPSLAVACKMLSFEQIQNEYVYQDNAGVIPALTLYGEQLAYFNENREAMAQFYEDDLNDLERAAFWKDFIDLPGFERKLGFLRF